MVRKAQQSRLPSRNPWLKPLPKPLAQPLRAPKPPKPRLPQELIDQIIDEIWDRPEALKSCSLVSHSFLLQTRQHLFSKFDIQLPCPTRNSRLKALLDKSTYLAKYIKDLVVVILGPTRTIHATSVVGEDPLLRILPSLTQISKLTIKAYGGVPKDWQIEVTSDARAIFSSILVAKRVQSFSLHSILNFDTILLARCSSLRYLELSGESTLTPYRLPEYYTIQPPRLSSLTIGAYDDSLQSFLDCCTAPEPAFTVNIISIDIHDELAMRTFGNLPFLSFTLENLVIRLRINPDGFPVSEIVNLSQFRVISTLELLCIDDWRVNETIFTIRSMRILETLSQPCKLQKITFVYDPNPGRCTVAYPLNEAYWSCVDCALFYLQLQPSSVVHFRYGINVLLSDPLKVFPRVRSLGIEVRVSAIL